MKKLNYLLLGLVAIGMVFTSCEPDEEEDKSPNLNLKGGAEYISADATLTVGKSFVIGVTASPNSISSEKLTKLKVTRTFDNVPSVLLDSTLDKLTSLDIDLKFFAQKTVGSEKINIEITDKKGETATKTVTITTEAGAIELKEFETVLLGAQNNTSNGSAASLTSGKVYKISGDDAKNNSANVDIVYYVGARQEALYSPSNADIQKVTSYAISSWATKNATKIKTTAKTASDFSALKTDKDLSAWDAAAGDVEGTLDQDDVLVFETQSGKKGAIKIVEVVSGASGKITLQIKVEQ